MGLSKTLAGGAATADRAAQRRPLGWQIVLLDDLVRPDAVEEFLLADQRSFGLEQDQQQIEGACPQRDRHAVGEQLSSAQQDTEAAEFEHLAGCGWARAAARSLAYRRDV
jgi:hypothetical protein